MITNGYVTLDEFKRRQKGVPADGSDDTQIMRHIERASRWIDQYCGRNFYSTLDTRHFQARFNDSIFIDDLVSITSLATDQNGDEVFETVWDSTDYDLEPYNARLISPPKPYTSIRVSPLSKQYFPRLMSWSGYIGRSVEIAGKWGYSDYVVQLSTVGTGGITSGATSLPVASAASFEVGNLLLVGTEQMACDAVSLTANALTVRRGLNGTTAAAHVLGDAVSAYDFGDVSEACGLLAQRYYLRRLTVLGTQGASMFGTITQKVAVDPDLVQMLDPYRRLT